MSLFCVLMHMYEWNVTKTDLRAQFDVSGESLSLHPELCVVGTVDGRCAD